MRRCYGRTLNFRRCGRYGDWSLFCDDHRYQPFGWLFVLVFTVGGSMASYYGAFSPFSKNSEAQHFPPAPERTGGGSADLALEFVGKERLQFLYVNLSDESANQPKRFFGLWDINRPYYRETNRVIQALPLAWKTEMDFVFHNSKQGPMDVLDDPTALGHVKVGDHLFGWADVMCLNCVRERDYWVYFEVGVGGWYKEMTKPPWGGSIQIPREGSSYQQQTAAIDAEVPREGRIQMKER